jgi:hypothetical protein
VAVIPKCTDDLLATDLNNILFTDSADIIFLRLFDLEGLLLVDGIGSKNLLQDHVPGSMQSSCVQLVRKVLAGYNIPDQEEIKTKPKTIVFNPNIKK